MKKSLVLIACLAAASLAAPNRLVLVDLEAPASLDALFERGYTVVEDLGEAALVRASSAEAERLASEFGAQVLDTGTEGRSYVFLTPGPGFDRARLAGLGEVLAVLDGGLIVRTTEQGVAAMTRLPVEVARIAERPLAPQHGLDGPPPLPVVDDSLVQALAASVDEDSVEGFISRLVAFHTRYSTEDSCRRAVEWMRARLDAYGCDSTYLDTFQYDLAPNAVGIRHGTVNPQRIYIVCGHIDNTSEIPETWAPGSDDNASGTTAALEAARVFQEVDFENTVVFIGFAGEEQGLLGSEAYANEAAGRGDSILAVLNFDMISYGRQNLDTLEVIGKRSSPNCTWLVDYYIAQADTFSVLKPKKVMVNSAPYSDHHSFWERGYVAFCGIEEDFTPCYHTTGDTIGPLYYTDCGTNNLGMATEAIRAGVVTLAKLAGAYDPTGVAEQPARPRPARLVAVEPTIGGVPFRLALSGPLRPGGSVEVYDATGRLVRAVGVPGTSQGVWDGTGADGTPSGRGIYLFRVIDGSCTTTAKAVLAD